MNSEWVSENQVGIIAAAEAILALAVIVAGLAGVDIEPELVAAIMGALAAVLGLFTRPKVVAIEALERLNE